MSYNNYNYSYLNVATDEFGYYTLSFDRLGVGNSSHGDPVNEIQSFLEISATVELTKMLRAGTFPGMNHTFEKVVHVGHSFGSAQTYSLANMYPNLTDGIVLTGFSMTPTFATLFIAGGNFQLANVNQPLRFGAVNGTSVHTLLSEFAPNSVFFAPLELSALPAPQNLSNGYIISSDIQANKYLFLKPNYYDPAILTLAESTKQPVTIGEILTLMSVPMTNNFPGPTFLIRGGEFHSKLYHIRNYANYLRSDSDLPYCGDNCLNLMGVGPDLLSRVSANFPNVPAGNFVSYIQPDTGHGLNTHYNATAGYRVINNFLASKNLQSS